MFKTCHINKQGIFVDESLVLAATDSERWLNDLYVASEMNYPKFYKMDHLSKLGILAVEALKKGDNPFEQFKDDEIAFIFANKNSSFDTDEKFIESYQVAGNPSPSLFVYTLPNIVMGEIAIMNKWYGENTFYIREKFDADLFIQQSSLYLNRGNKACLCAWIDYKENDVSCFLFLTDKEGLKNLQNNELNKRYKHTTI